QVQVPDDGGGGQVKNLFHRGLDLVVAGSAGAEGVHHDRHGLRHADGIGQLHLAPAGQARGHDVLGHPAGGVGGAAVHLAGVLAREGAAAVAGVAAVGVHDDLAPGQAAVALGPADDEPPGGVDEVFGVLVQQGGGDDGPDHLVHHIGPQPVHLDVLPVLGGDDHRVHPDGAVALVLHRHLAFAVGAQIVHLAALAHLGQAAGQLVGQADGQGHQLGGLVAGVAEHHALVAGAAHLVVGAQGDVGALAVDVGDDGAGVGVKAGFGAGVAD